MVSTAAARTKLWVLWRVGRRRREVLAREEEEGEDLRPEKDGTESVERETR